MSPRRRFLPVELNLPNYTAVITIPQNEVKISMNRAKDTPVRGDRSTKIASIKFSEIRTPTL